MQEAAKPLPGVSYTACGRHQRAKSAAGPLVPPATVQLHATYGRTAADATDATATNALLAARCLVFEEAVLVVVVERCLKAVLLLVLLLVVLLVVLLGVLAALSHPVRGSPIIGSTPTGVGGRG